MTDYMLITKYRNKKEAEYLLEELEKMGKTCYSCFDTPADPDNPTATPEEQMQVYEGTKDFFNSKYINYIFRKDLAGLKNAKTIIMLLPAGNSVHMEAGIAYGLGKPVILIGQPEKAESLYMLFKERYPTIEDFLASI